MSHNDRSSFVHVSFACIYRGYHRTSFMDYGPLQQSFRSRSYLILQ